MVPEQFEDIFYIIEELREDSFASKNVKEFLSKIENELKNSDGETSLIVNRVLDLIEDLTNEKDIPAHIRISLLNMASILESF